ncbi:hypothetical protein H8356DRAFT_1077960 [Neocallimastix lanati (nom. inval.)]|nr:hypothetical protein H8356DRAFT_1077960 [Neocallimastix sp. JGI-2020a]
MNIHLSKRLKTITNNQENDKYISSSEIKEIIIKHGVDINEEKWNGETPLFGAIKSRNRYLVKYLVEHGADINKRNKYRELPYIYSINRRNYDIGNYLRSVKVVKKN